MWNENQCGGGRVDRADGRARDEIGRGRALGGAAWISRRIPSVPTGKVWQPRRTEQVGTTLRPSCVRVYTIFTAEYREPVTTNRNNSRVLLLAHPNRSRPRVARRELDDAVLVLQEKGAPPITSGPGRSSSAVGAGVSSGSGGPAADMYERLVKAVLGRDKEASARRGAQETVEQLLRVLQDQAQNLKVRTTSCVYDGATTVGWRLHFFSRCFFMAPFLSMFTALEGG